MGYVTRTDFVGYVNQGEARIGAQHLGFDGRHVMVAISGIAKKGDNGHE